MKLNLRRSKSERQANVLVQQQGEEGDDEAFSGNGDEFEVVTGDAPNPDIGESAKLKKQKFSLVRMMSKTSTSTSKLAATEEETPGAPATATATATLDVPPSSPASTANSTTMGEGETPPPKKKKNSKFMKKLFRKTSDIFKSDDGGTTERITVGDEYAIISVKPKTVSWDNNSNNNNNNNNNKSKQQQESPSSMPNEQYESGLKKQKFSLLRKFSSSSRRSKKNEHQDQDDEYDKESMSMPMQKSMSTPTPHFEQEELKNQRFSLVPHFSSRRRNKD